MNPLYFRSDVVREIFFHFTEVREGDNVDLGDDVEFTIQVYFSFISNISLTLDTSLQLCAPPPPPP